MGTRGIPNDNLGQWFSIIDVLRNPSKSAEMVEDHVRGEGKEKALVNYNNDLIHG